MLGAPSPLVGLVGQRLNAAAVSCGDELGTLSVTRENRGLARRAGPDPTPDASVVVKVTIRSAGLRAITSQR
jgi:hypothetical protein